jgi:hypothetical protein
VVWRLPGSDQQAAAAAWRRCYDWPPPAGRSRTRRPGLPFPVGVLSAGESESALLGLGPGVRIRALMKSLQHRPT